MPSCGISRLLSRIRALIRRELIECRDAGIYAMPRRASSMAYAIRRHFYYYIRAGDEQTGRRRCIEAPAVPRHERRAHFSKRASH